MSDPCPVCERNTHTNHLIWLVSDTDEFSNTLTGNTVERPEPQSEENLNTYPWPYIKPNSDIKPGDIVRARNTPEGRTIQVIREHPKPTDMERIVNALKSVTMYHQGTPAEGVLLDIINELEREA